MRKYKIKHWAVVNKDYPIPLCNANGLFNGEKFTPNMTFDTKEKAIAILKHSGKKGK